MDAIRYLDADTILDYLHNSSETYLEGLIPQSYGFPTETDRSVYVRLLKVPEGLKHKSAAMVAGSNDCFLYFLAVLLPKCANGIE